MRNVEGGGGECAYEFITHRPDKNPIIVKENEGKRIVVRDEQFVFGCGSLRAKSVSVLNFIFV